MVFAAKGAGGLTGAATDKRIDNESISELISETIQVRQNLEVTGQRDRQETAAAAALAF